MAIQIQVKLDINATPPVTTVPTQQAVNRGNSTIEWTPFASENFTFVSLTGLPNPPFSNLNVSAGQITVQDDNSATADYSYVITVQSGGQNYSSASSMASGHKNMGGESARTMAMLGGTNSPTIKNN